MIKSFRHKGLKRFYDNDDPRGLPADKIEHIRTILTALDQAKKIEDLNLPSFHLHGLKGNYKSYWSVAVRANWRVIFQFKAETALFVDLVDYH